MRRDTEMGRTENFIVANGMSQLYTGAQDVSPYSAFDDVLSNGNNDIEFSELASGAMRRARRKFKKPRQSTGSSRRAVNSKKRRPSGVGGKVGKFFDDTKAGISNFQKRKKAENEAIAQQQKAVLDQVSKNTPTVEQLNALMATPSAGVNTTPQKQPMSKGLKIGLIVGGVVVAGVIAYVVYKKMKNKGK